MYWQRSWLNFDRYFSYKSTPTRIGWRIDRRSFKGLNRRFASREPPYSSVLRPQSSAAGLHAYEGTHESPVRNLRGIIVLNNKFLCLSHRKDSCWIDMTSCNLILCLPPTTERSEYAHGGSRSVRSVSVEFILSDQQLTVCIEDIGESDRASTICLLREIAGFDE
jgi:hypothetical protein